MKKVCQKKNYFGHTRVVYTHSESEIRKGASHGFFAKVITKAGNKKTTGYFTSADEALTRTWMTEPDNEPRRN